MECIINNLYYDCKYLLVCVRVRACAFVFVGVSSPSEESAASFLWKMPQMSFTHRAGGERAGEISFYLCAKPLLFNESLLLYLTMNSWYTVCLAVLYSKSNIRFCVIYPHVGVHVFEWCPRSPQLPAADVGFISRCSSALHPWTQTAESSAKLHPRACLHRPRATQPQQHW